MVVFCLSVSVCLSLSLSVCLFVVLRAIYDLILIVCDCQVPFGSVSVLFASEKSSK